MGKRTASGSGSPFLNLCFLSSFSSGEIRLLKGQNSGMQQSGILRSVGGQKERSAVSVFFDKADNLMLGVPVKAGKGFVHDKGITVGEQGAGRL